MEWNHCGFVYLFNSSQAQLETQIHIAVAVGWCEFGTKIYSTRVSWRCLALALALSALLI